MERFCVPFLIYISTLIITRIFSYVNENPSKKEVP